MPLMWLSFPGASPRHTLPQVPCSQPLPPATMMLPGRWQGTSNSYTYTKGQDGWPLCRLGPILLHTPRAPVRGAAASKTRPLPLLARAARSWPCQELCHSHKPDERAIQPLLPCELRMAVSYAEHAGHTAHWHATCWSTSACTTLGLSPSSKQSMPCLKLTCQFMHRVLLPHTNNQASDASNGGLCRNPWTTSLACWAWVQPPSTLGGRGCRGW